MSLTDKIIKNTYYYVFSQIAAILVPLVLTPYIIYKIGEQQFGIYAIVIGFTTSFGLFDLSISSSFIKFISEHYNKNQIKELNHTVNTGFVFYFLFSLMICAAGYLLNDFLLGFINIPPELKEAGRNSLNIALLIFFVNNVFLIYSSVLISIQKMYLTSLMTAITSVLNLAVVFILLSAGFKVEGILISQLITSAVNSVVLFVLAKKSVPELSMKQGLFSTKSFREMGSFGIQMQVSKLAGFFSEKYDEFLLGFFSILNNVTYFNVSTRLLRLARFLPMQLIIQVAPVAAEFKAKEDKEKLRLLFDDSIKYLTLVSVPVAVFMFVFAGEIVRTWLGTGYDISAHILRILLVAQLINLVISSPGNSIIPNTGVPKYQMFEGLIHLGINVVASYLFIKYYGIIGAAYGNGIATIISSLFIFATSLVFFRKNLKEIVLRNYLYPVLISIAAGTLFYFILWFLYKSGFSINSRLSGLAVLAVFFVMYFTLYTGLVVKSDYLNSRNKTVLARLIAKIIPAKYKSGRHYKLQNYEGEKVSIFILTFNKAGALEKCLKGLMPSVRGINSELIIYNNASTDRTKEFLDGFVKEYPGVKIFNSTINSGNNAKSLAAELCTGDYIIGADDDVIEFPQGWVEKMVSAYKSVPEMGYLVTDVIQDDKTNGAKFPEEKYLDREYFGGAVTIQEGPAGGWCFMISRKVYNECGKLLMLKDRKFVFEDGDYQLRTQNRGFKTGILKGLKVYHATGEYYNNLFGNPLMDKYKESVKKLPFTYVVKRKLKSMFSIRGIIRRILNLSESAV